MPHSPTAWMSLNSSPASMEPALLGAVAGAMDVLEGGHPPDPDDALRDAPVSCVRRAEAAYTASATRRGRSAGRCRRPYRWSRRIPGMQRWPPRSATARFSARSIPASRSSTCTVIESRQPVPRLHRHRFAAAGERQLDRPRFLAWLPPERLDAILHEKLPRWARKRSSIAARCCASSKRSARAASRRRSVRLRSRHRWRRGADLSRSTAARWPRSAYRRPLPDRRRMEQAGAGAVMAAAEIKRGRMAC